MAQTIYLTELTSLPVESQLQIRDLRNRSEIRAVMYSDHLIALNEHLQWLRTLKDDRTQIVFAVVEETKTPLGLVSLRKIDRVHKKADWAFYLAGDRKIGLAPALELSLIDFAFERLGLEKLNCEVLEGNAAVLKLHSRFFFEAEGFRKSEIVKDGCRLGVHMLGLRRDVWLAKRASLLDRYRLLFEGFNIQVNWTDSEQQQSPIDRIETARARNNLNWMNILRIALDRSPEFAGQLIAEIKTIDQEISGLTQTLIESIKDTR